MSHRRLLAIAALVGVISVAISPLAAAAHVNRTAGPYAFLLFLVEEPTYEDNHAGFELSIRKDEIPLPGLEAGLSAAATGHGQVVDLAIGPMDPSGYYVLDHLADGTAFDPLGGGDWVLTLNGAIEGTPISLQFPVRFPSYPRIGSVTPGQSPGGAADVGGSPSLGAMLAGALVALLAFGLVGRGLNRRRGR